MWKKKDYFDGFKLVYEYEEKTLVKNKEIVAKGFLTQEKFELSSYLEWLPKKFKFIHYSNQLETDILRCEGTCSNARPSCWCDVSEKLVFKDYHTKTFRLTSKTSHNYVVDVQIKRKPGTTDQVDLTLSIRYNNAASSSHIWKNWNNSTNNSYSYGTNIYGANSTTKLSFLDETGHEIEYTDQNTFAKSEFSFKFHQLPNKLELKYYSSVYSSWDNLSCHLRQSGNYRQECPNLCWCQLINQLRATQSGKIRIPIFTITYENKLAKYSNYFLIINAQVDQENHDQIEIKIKLVNNPYYDMDDTSFVDFL